ncbi:MAG: thioesterase family protein [Acidobacteriota bacterium]|nr:MAG: thioesterase family protein [Acidobacteriota bacterium]
MAMEIWTGRVEPNWIDYNGHMNVAYYHMAFDHSTDRFLDKIGLGEEYLAREPGSMFALEDHMTYQRELEEGDPLRITLQLLDFDEKRVHYFLRMYHAEKDSLAATMEHLSIFIDMRLRRSTPMPPEVHEALAEVFEAHRHLGRPEEVGRLMGIRRR